MAIVLIGLPASIRATLRPLRIAVRNPTALAMVVGWVFGWSIYQATGIGMPIQTMVLCDWAVITVIYSKSDWSDCAPYSGWRHQLCAVWLERSPWDRAIIALFPFVWFFYTPIVDIYYRYWALYGLGLAQLMLAGREALNPWLERMAITLPAATPGHDPPGMELDAAWSLARYERSDVFELA